MQTRLTDLHRAVAAEPKVLSSVHTHRHKNSSGTDNNDADEYMTALTSRADSIAAASPLLGSPNVQQTESADDEEDKEELASFAVPMQSTSVDIEDTPRKNSTKPDAVVHPDSPTPDQTYAFSPSIASLSPIDETGQRADLPGITPLMPLPPLSASSAGSSIDAYEERMSASPMGVRRSFSNKRLPSTADVDSAGTATIIRRVS